MTLLEPSVGALVYAAESVDTFTPPKVEQTRNPKYPDDLLAKGREGWVTVNYMVNPEGEPYDVMVSATSGERDFERAAVAAIKRWRFSPAVLDGEFIDAGGMHRITFRVRGQEGASRGFSRNYKKMLSALFTQDREQADKYLDRLQRQDRNIYEESFYHLAIYNYAVQWGSEAEQYRALSRATFMDGGLGFLPDEALTSALFSELGLELKLGKLGQAVRTARQLLERELTPDRQAKVEQLLAQLEAAARSEQALVSVGRINQGYRFTHRLLKPSFSFTEVQGDIAELRLHCDKGYVGFIYEEGMTYSVAEGVGDCFLTAIGDPDTTFKLIES